MMGCNGLSPNFVFKIKWIWANWLTSISPEILTSSLMLSGGIEVNQFAELRSILEAKFSHEP